MIDYIRDYQDTTYKDVVFHESPTGNKVQVLVLDADGEIVQDFGWKFRSNPKTWDLVEELEKEIYEENRENGWSQYGTKIAMSTKAKIIKENFMSHCGQIATHIAKMYLHSDLPAYDYHWPTEVRAFYGDTEKIKKKNGRDVYPDSLDFVSWFDEAKGDMLDDILLAVIRDSSYPEITMPYSEEEFIAICFDYIKWLGETLSQYGAVSQSEVREKLHNLIDKEGK